KGDTEPGSFAASFKRSYFSLLAWLFSLAWRYLEFAAWSCDSISGASRVTNSCPFFTRDPRSTYICFTNPFTLGKRFTSLKGTSLPGSFAELERAFSDTLPNWYLLATCFDEAVRSTGF